MEEEIDLTQLIATLWKGKFIIITITLAAIVIALLASTVFVTPEYRATAYIDLLDYQDDDRIDEFMRRPDREVLLEEALSDLTPEPRRLARSITMEDSGDYPGFFEVVATSPDPELAAAAANESSLYLLRWSSEHDLDQLLQRKESSEQALEFFDEQLRAATGQALNGDDNNDLASGYIESSLRLMAEELVLKRETLKQDLEKYDQYILATFSQLTQQDLEEALSDKQLINPAYQAVMEKRGRLLSDIFEVEQALALIEEGRLPDLEMASGTVFETVVTARESLRSNMVDLIVKINQAEYDLEHLEEERYLYQAEVPQSPFNLRWQLNTAVAGVLGLMVSVFLVFMIPFAKNLRENLKEDK